MHLFKYICLLTLVVHAPVRGDMPRGDLYLAFTQANQAFARANENLDNPQLARREYEKAILEYERIIDQGGIKNVKLYYNLANAHLLGGNLGKAILNYRRAQRLDAADPDIHKNLTFARARRLDKIPADASERILQRLFFWHYDFSMKTRVILAGFAFALLCIWLTLRIWLPRLPRLLPLCMILLVLIIAMASSAAAEQTLAGRNQSGVILDEYVTARQGDGLNYPESFTEPLHEGTEFDLIQQRPGWLHIQLPDGTQAWIPASAAELI